MWCKFKSLLLIPSFSFLEHLEERERIIFFPFCAIYMGNICKGSLLKSKPFHYLDGKIQNHRSLQFPIFIPVYIGDFRIFWIKSYLKCSYGIIFFVSLNESHDV